MVPMTVAAILGVIALLGAIVAWATWHRGADERQSVNHHQHTLQTLGHLADRGARSTRPSSRSRSTASKGPPPPRPTPKAKGVAGAERNGTPHRSGNGVRHGSGHGVRYGSGNGAPRTKKAAPSFWGSAGAPSAPSTTASATDRSHATRQSTATPASGKESAKVQAGRRETV